MKFLCDIKLGELGALQVKSLHQNWIRQQPSTISRQPCSSTYHIRGLWYAYFRVMFLKCRAASSFIRDLGTRTFIILDVIWTCQFLPQWPLSLSILKLNICWAKSTDKLALHPADYLAVENGCLKIEIRVLKLLNGLKAIYEQNLRPPLKDQAQYV